MNRTNKIYKGNILAYYDIGITYNVPLSMIPLYLTLCDLRLGQFESTKRFYREIKLNSQNRFYVVADFIKQYT